ncbi:MAG: aldehyde dehydrogenase family protein [Prochlorococcaceae cyanobacterium]
MTALTPLREPVLAGTTRGVAWRLQQLQRLAELLQAVEQPLLQALHDDLGRPPLEAWIEWRGVRDELILTRRRLRAWMARRPLRTGLLQWPARAWLQPEPLGCVLILAPWNYPFLLSLDPLISALAAGNTAVLKPSEHAPAVAALLAEVLPRHLPADVVQVVTGDAATARQWLQEPFDHVFFTGGTAVGREVMAAAARQLTPVTLELGGRNPCLVLDDADLPVAARRIVWGRFLNAGQTCLAPDHVLVTPGLRQPLEQALVEAIGVAYGPDPQQSPDYGRVVSTAHHDRLQGLLQGAEVLCGGSGDRESRYLAPTVVRCGADHPLLQEEIFGPVLPVLPIADLEEGLERIGQQPQPLAIYLFSRSVAAREAVLRRTRSGSVVFNDVVLQAAAPTLPFGGVGPSGHGRCHGQAGFDTFSNLRTVLARPAGWDVPLRYPPYGNRLGLARRLP